MGDRQLKRFECCHAGLTIGVDLRALAGEQGSYAGLEERPGVARSALAGQCLTYSAFGDRRGEVPRGQRFSKNDRGLSAMVRSGNAVWKWPGPLVTANIS